MIAGGLREVHEAMAIGALATVSAAALVRRQALAGAIKAKDGARFASVFVQLCGMPRHRRKRQRTHE